MIKIKYNVALIGFYQIKNAHNGASEVSLSLYSSITAITKKLFEIKNPNFYFKNKKLINCINSFFLKPIKIIYQIFLVKKFFKNKEQKLIIIEGASWIGYSFFFIKVLKIIMPEAVIIYHAHNIEYEIRKLKNNKLIITLSKYFEKKVYQDSTYATVVSEIDQKKIYKLYKVASTVFYNGISKNRIKVGKGKKKKYRYIIYSGNYFYRPNQIAIQKLIKIVSILNNKKFSDLKLIITGSELPEKIFNNKNIIFKKKINKLKLNYLIKNSICTILPLIKSPGTKLKIIESLLLGNIIIGSKHAFIGIDCASTNPPFTFKNFNNIIYYLNLITKNPKYYNYKAKKQIKNYQKKYLMDNIWKDFCIDKSLINKNNNAKIKNR
jgi:hypothetical protein